ncbi:MAG: hypothetical protein WKF47_19315 [Geodermatophilaceae bacterium]
MSLAVVVGVLGATGELNSSRLAAQRREVDRAAALVGDRRRVEQQRQRLVAAYVGPSSPAAGRSATSCWANCSGVTPVAPGLRDDVLGQVLARRRRSAPGRRMASRMQLGGDRLLRVGSQLRVELLLGLPLGLQVVRRGSARSPRSWWAMLCWRQSTSPATTDSGSGTSTAADQRLEQLVAGLDALLHRA